MRALNIRWLGNLPYAEALTLQKGLHNSVSDGNNEEDYLLLLAWNFFDEIKKKNADLAHKFISIKDLEN